MSGLFLLVVAGLWLLLVFKASSFVGKRASGNRVWGTWLSFALFLLLLPLPVIDEIVGGFQFRAICEDKASRFHVGVANPEGRTTRVTVDPSNRYLEGKAIPIRHSRFVYRDAVTGEQVLAFDEYVAEGGALVRALGVSENNSPITIGVPACSPEQSRAESARLTFKLNVVR